MHKCKTIMAVTLVTALIVSFCIPVHAAGQFETVSGTYDKGILPPSPDYPLESNLPYGENTLVYDFYFYTYTQNEYFVHRYYLPNVVNTSATSIEDATPGADYITCALIGNSSGQANLVIDTPSSYVEQTFYVDLNNNSIYGWSAPERKTDMYKLGTEMYPTWNSDLNQSNASTILYANSKPCLGGYLYGPNVTGFNDFIASDVVAKYWFPYTGVYVLQKDAQYYDGKDITTTEPPPTTNVVDEIGGVIESEFDEQNQIIQEGFDSVNNSINQGVTQIDQAIKDGVDDIINAGSDAPTLSLPDSSEIFDSINGWASELDEFADSLDENKAENQENLKNAGELIKGFFGSMKGGMVAALSLCLVFLVVIKVIGR